MEKRKLTKEDIDKVRNIDGFPIGTDEDIIALSDAPYYTACPNPFIEEFINENGHPYDEKTDDYHREPFASDVSEGKNDRIYMEHSYHTKVPYKAIMRYILHYTNPGDIVFDGFCGTGMTGLAAKMCGQPDGETKYQLEHEMKNISWGNRNSILMDLSPIATYIARSYNTPINAVEFQKTTEKIIQECDQELSWMFETNHVQNGVVEKDIFGQPIKGEINYILWSDVLICPNCSKEFSFYEAAVDEAKGKVLNKFYCPHCHVELTKNSANRAFETKYDEELGKSVKLAKQVPISIHYFVNGKRYEKKPDQNDIELLEKIEKYKIPYWIPIEQLPNGFNTDQPKKSHGITYVHQFYTKRNLAVLAAFCAKARQTKYSLILMQSVATVNTKMYRYRWAGGVPGAGGGQLAGTLYIPSLFKDISMLKSLKEYLNKTVKAKVLQENIDGKYLISTQSSTEIPDKKIHNSIDYIFVDPPFGSNLNYSELSYIWESWLRVKTNNTDEAIINAVQGKSLNEYQQLMSKCFANFYQILKPGHWITVEFHNSQNSVWNAISEAIGSAGFVIADVRTLDKKQGSFKQVTSNAAVKQDLVISAYKPTEELIDNFINNAGSEEFVWSFIRQHLSNLPIAPDGDHDGKIDIVAERQNYLLYDRMVAWHVMHGVAVPMGSTEFYQGLEEHYLKRDGMYFLPEQVNEYDRKRAFMELENVQEAFTIIDEKGAIQWLNYQLATPQTYQELQPKYLQELHQLRTEKMPELMELLNENFLQDEDGKWYIPDIRKAGDVEKLREKSLLKEFESYLSGKGKLKVFRSEAIRAGFSKLWKEKDYKNIVAIAERLPEATIQEDPNLLMYYDISLSRV